MEEDMVSHRPKPDDELALNLYNNTMTGDWKKIVEMYNEHKFSAIDARINPSGDTVLHVAVAIAPEHIVKELVRVISQTSEMSLWIKNNDGNTPLHVAASTGRFIICIILAKVLDELSDFSDELQKLFRNEAGESPLFLAAFHGHKPSFLYLHLLLLEAYDTDMERSNPIYRRNDGETALHCAIRWEYFDMAYEILLVEPSLAYARNQLGITPLHLLASKPSLFRSGSHLGWWKNIIYYCIYVEELKHETVREELIDSVIKELDESSEIKDNNFPETYQTCIHFYQPLQTMSQFGMK
nr:nuclear factor NF-kappa-B p105 subunit-like [Quercus suber]